MNNDRLDIRTEFNKVSRKYDEQRRKLIPCFEDLYGIAAALAVLGKDSPRVLDLGAGTGIMSSFILEKYPKSKLTLIDLSDGMLEIAKERFSDHSNITYIASDYTTFDYKEQYDLVISSLSIHHLIDSDKQKLFKKLYSTMTPGSIFINVDQVLGNTDYLENLYKSDWKMYIEESGLDMYEISSAIERTKLDRMSTLDQQLQWLIHAGFADVDCVYKYYNFVVMFARKIEG